MRSVASVEGLPIEDGAWGLVRAARGWPANELSGKKKYQHPFGSCGQRHGPRSGELGLGHHPSRGECFHCHRAGDGQRDSPVTGSRGVSTRHPAAVQHAGWSVQVVECEAGEHEREDGGTQRWARVPYKNLGGSGVEAAMGIRGAERSVVRAGRGGETAAVR